MAQDFHHESVEDLTALSYIRARYSNGYDQEIQNRVREELEERDRKAREAKVAWAKAGNKKPDPNLRFGLLVVFSTCCQW